MGGFVCVHDVNYNKIYEMAGTFFKNTYVIVDEMRFGFYEYKLLWPETQIRIYTYGIFAYFSVTSCCGQHFAE